MSPMAWVIAILVKPAVVVAGAALAASLLGKRGAAARHAVWAGAAAAVLLLPILARILPPLRPPNAVGVVSTASRVGDIRPLAHTTTPAAALARRGVSAPIPVRWTPDAADVMRDLGGALPILWGVVAAALLVRRARAELVARRIVARGSVPSETLARRCAAIATRHGVHGRVRLIVDDDMASPAVAGLRRQTLILPSAAESWSDAQLAAVVAHELAHVARRDGLVNFVADLAAAVYWCNPLVRLAARQVRGEAERACDDDVLIAGTDADGYALTLLDLARAARDARALPHAVTAAVRPSELESRLTRILDRRLVRSPVRRRTRGVAAVVGLLVAAPVAAATTVRAASQAGPIASASSGAPEPDQLQDSVATGERVPAVVDEATITAAVRRALAGPDSAAAERLLPALSHAPSHPNDLVRERAAWALSQTRGTQLLEPVIEALASRDWRVQAYAAWTLGVVRERRAVDLLVPLVRHPVWRVRAMAAFALGELLDRRSLDVMVAALDDPAWQVRSEAVEYVGTLREPQYQSLIGARLRDRHVAVRAAAANALTTP